MLTPRCSANRDDPSCTTFCPSGGALFSSRPRSLAPWNLLHFASLAAPRSSWHIYSKCIIIRAHAARTGVRECFNKYKYVMRYKWWRVPSNDWEKGCFRPAVVYAVLSCAIVFKRELPCKSVAIISCDWRCNLIYKLIKKLLFLALLLKFCPNNLKRSNINIFIEYIVKLYRVHRSVS